MNGTMAPAGTNSEWPSEVTVAPMASPCSSELCASWWNSGGTAHRNGTTLREEAVGGGYVTEAEFAAIVDPKKMIGPE